MVFAMFHLGCRNLESVRIGPFWPGGLMPATPMVMSRLVALSLTFSCRVLLGLICRFGFVCVSSSVDPWTVGRHLEPSVDTVGRHTMSNICMFWNAVFVTWLGRAGIYWIPGRIAIAWFSLSNLSIGIFSTRQIWQSLFLDDIDEQVFSSISCTLAWVHLFLHVFGTHDLHRSIFQLLTFSVCHYQSVGFCVMLSAHFNPFLYARLKCLSLAIFAWKSVDKIDKSFW